jgi:uncharacterized protein YeaO (DUF488 family)
MVRREKVDVGADGDRVRLKRAYEPASPEDGTRVLVERLWPRGVSRAAAALDDWAKEIAPSPELRTWYGHDVARWPEFRRRYLAELAAKAGAVEALREQALAGRLTLVFAAHDPEHSSAAVLRDVLAGSD